MSMIFLAPPMDHTRIITMTSVDSSTCRTMREVALCDAASEIQLMEQPVDIRVYFDIFLGVMKDARLDFDDFLKGTWPMPWRGLGDRRYLDHAVEQLPPGTVILECDHVRVPYL